MFVEDGPLNRGFLRGKYDKRSLDNIRAVVIHTTGGGIIRRWRRERARFPSHTPFDTALRVYHKLMDAGPHYVVGQEGRVAQTCPCGQVCATGLVWPTLRGRPRGTSCADLPARVRGVACREESVLGVLEQERSSQVEQVRLVAGALACSPVPSRAGRWISMERGTMQSKCSGHRSCSAHRRPNWSRSMVACV